MYRCEIRPSSAPGVRPDLDVMEDLLKIKLGNYFAGSVAIHLPLYLVIRNSFFEENVLRFSAEFHQEMKNDVNLGIIPKTPKGESKRYSRPINEEKLKISDGSYYYEDNPLSVIQ